MPNDALTRLADVLSAADDVPMTRLGQVVSVDLTSTAWMVDVRVEGDAGTRRCRWVGTGAQPKPGEIVTYLNESPFPLVLGRVSDQTNEVQTDFGSAPVNAGSYTDSSGPIRPAITSASSAAAAASAAAQQAFNTGSAAQTSASQAISNAGAASSAASAAQSAANNAASAASAANSAANNALNTANNVNSRVNTLQNQVNNIQGQVNANNAFAVSLERSLIEAYNQINFLNTRINNVEAYAVSLEGTLISFLGSGGPDD